MKRSTQTSFAKYNFKVPKHDVFGGSELKGNPRVKRFIPRRSPLHITLKSEIAVRRFSMMSHSREIHKIIQYKAALFGVKLYDFVNVGNHIHILAQFHNKLIYHRFIRSISGLIARQVLGVKRGKPFSDSSTQGAKFWSYRPYTKIIHGGRRHYQNIKSYMAKNRLDAFGVDRKNLIDRDPATEAFFAIMKTLDPVWTLRFQV